MLVNRIRNDLYNSIYDLLVLVKLHDTGIYEADNFLYNEVLEECERLHDEYLAEDGNCCVHERPTLFECVQDESIPKCPQERKVFELFHNVRHEINSKWYGTAR